LLHKRLVDLNVWIETIVRPRSKEINNPETKAKF